VFLGITESFIVLHFIQLKSRIMWGKHVTPESVRIGIKSGRSGARLLEDETMAIQI